MVEETKSMNVWREIVVRSSEEPGNTFVVYEVPDLASAKDKCLELLRGHSNIGCCLPLCHQAIVRQGSGDFEVGEYVVHIGSLESSDMLRLGKVIRVDVPGTTRCTVPCIALVDAGPLFEERVPQCSVCHLEFLSTEIRCQIFMDDETCIEYCDKCQAVLVDIAKKLAEKKAV